MSTHDAKVRFVRPKAAKGRERRWRRLSTFPDRNIFNMNAGISGQPYLLNHLLLQGKRFLTTVCIMAMALEHSKKNTTPEVLYSQELLDGKQRLVEEQNGKQTAVKNGTSALNFSPAINSWRFAERK